MPVTLTPSPPNTVAVVQNILAMMSALSGVVTDYNIGSQVRTQTESIGATVDMQGVANSQALLVALAYGSASAYGIEAYPAQSATGTVTFATSFTSPAAASQAVPIPAGTLVSTPGGIQYATSASGTLAQGATGINLGVSAVIGGPGGNTTANTVTTLLSNLGYPLFVNNAAPMVGGAAAESPSVTLARLAAKQTTFGLSSPYAIANAAIGVQGTDGSICQFASCYEPWLANNTTTAGFTLYIDNGSGAASSALITAVQNTITGSVSGSTSGYRPAGVPFAVSGVVPLYATVTVTGTLLPIVTAQTVEANIITAIDAYFSTLSFGTAAAQPQISAAASNAGLGYFTSLSVTLYSSGTPVSTIAASGFNRVILSGLTVTVTN